MHCDALQRKIKPMPLSGLQMTVTTFLIQYGMPPDRWRLLPTSSPEAFQAMDMQATATIPLQDLQLQIAIYADKTNVNATWSVDFVLRNLADAEKSLQSFQMALPNQLHDINFQRTNAQQFYNSKT